MLGLRELMHINSFVTEPQWKTPEAVATPYGYVLRVTNPQRQPTFYDTNTKNWVTDSQFCGRVVSWQYIQTIRTQLLTTIHLNDKVEITLCPVNT